MLCRRFQGLSQLTRHHLQFLAVYREISTKSYGWKKLSTKSVWPTKN